jgi:hypothetical protein
MHTVSRMRNRMLAAALAATMLTVMAAAPTIAARTTPVSSQSAELRVVAPTETYAGKTYSQWSAVWWKWALSIPEPNSPVTDDTGADCAIRQDQRAWLLAGNTGGSTSRACTVPASKAILLPVINAACWSPEDGETEADLRNCAASLMDEVTETSASIDGVPVDLGPASEGKFRFVSSLFTAKFADGNGFGVPEGKRNVVADGFWLIVKPMTVGAHTIDFHGSAPAFGFELTVHYDLTVVRP